MSLPVASLSLLNELAGDELPLPPPSSSMSRRSTSSSSLSHEPSLSALQLALSDMLRCAVAAAACLPAAHRRRELSEAAAAAVVVMHVIEEVPLSQAITHGRPLLMSCAGGPREAMCDVCKPHHNATVLSRHAAWWWCSLTVSRSVETVRVEYSWLE